MKKNMNDVIFRDDYLCYMGFKNAIIAKDGTLHLKKDSGNIVIVGWYKNADGSTWLPKKESSTRSLIKQIIREDL